MALICYQKRNFDEATKRTIARAVSILEEYAEQGYDLTLRQLYYQFVARGIIANKDTEYKRLGSIVNDARLAGLIDWDHITDRTRNMRQNSHWNSPQEIIETCGRQFQIDKWAKQANYAEVWVEKDALVGVLEVACQPLDVPYFSCRGYTSQSEMWSASQRLLSKLQAGKTVHIIHLGDHDPSGIDMSRDIEDRLRMFMKHHVVKDFVKANSRRDGEKADAYETRLSETLATYSEYVAPLTFHRIALNMAQVRQYDPPPNPAKITDSQAQAYIAKFGNESWELDALEPSVITALIQTTIEDLRDDDQWNAAVDEERRHRGKLAACAKQWPAIAARLR